MQAVILAAGMGKRLKSLTAGNTKCMVKVNGITLIERALRQLDDLSLDRIVVVVGYRGQQLIDYIATLNVKTPIEFIDNPIYDKTNNIYSLSLAKDVLVGDDTLLLESDLIFEDGILRSLVEDPRPTLALVDKYESWMDGTVVKLDNGDHISAFIPGKKFCFDDIPNYFKTVNVYKFSQAFSRDQYVPFLEAYSTALGNNEYYEQVLRVITLLDESELEVKRLNGQIWYEIDDLQDLDIAESLFAPSDEQRFDMVQSRYGGYWRYPRLCDLSNLSNPCYPPQRLLDEMKASFERLLTQRPSDNRIASLLAAKTFSLEVEHTVASDSTDTLADAVKAVRGDAPCVLVANPRAFFGKPLGAQQLEDIYAGCVANGALMVLDETLLDFCEDGVSWLTEEQLAAHPQAVVMKSLSICHGVSGARLAYAASADDQLIAAVKDLLPAHTVNAFGEFYLQIAEKYKKDYAASALQTIELRKQMVAALEAVAGVEIVNAQSNYVLVKVEGSAAEVAQRLLAESNVLVRDLSDDDKGEIIGIAVSQSVEPAQLANAFAHVCRK